MTWGSHCDICGKADCKWVHGPICEGSASSYITEKASRIATLEAEITRLRAGGEPTAAYTIDFTGCQYISTDVTNVEKIAAEGSKGPTEVHYLYDAPPAPAGPRVKALEVLRTELGWYSRTEHGALDGIPFKHVAHVIRVMIGRLSALETAAPAGGDGGVREAAWVLLSEIDSATDMDCVIAASAPLRAALSRPEAEPDAGEVERLRAIISKVCAALPNGAYCSPSVSIEFMEHVPDEVASVIAALRQQNAPGAEGWRPIETAPHNRTVILGWHDWRDGQWCMEIGPASWGTRVGAASNMSGHGSATHWLPTSILPASPGQDKGGA